MKKITLLLIAVFILPISFSIFSMESQKTEFFEAVRKGDIKVVDKLISENLVSINAQDNDGNTALMIAVKNKQTEMVKELIERDAGIYKQNNYGQTALTLAIEANNVKIIEEILNEVPDPTIIDEAINFAKTKKIRELLGDANVQKILLLLLKAENQYELYERIKEKKSDSDISDIKTFIATNPIISLNVTNIERNPLLAAIIDTGNSELVDFLIEQGADVNQNWGGPGITPLIAAITTVIAEVGVIEKPNIEIVTSLLKKGANPNMGFLINDTFVSPLTVAVKSLMGNIESLNLKSGLIELLVKHGAKINDIIRSEGKNTTLLILAVYTNVGLVQELLEAGADQSLQNSKGQTALDVAIIELDDAMKKLTKATKKLTKATSEGDKDRESQYDREMKEYYTKKKQNYENIIKLLKEKEKEIAGKKIPIKTATPDQLFSSLQKLTQSLKALQKTLAVK